MKTRFTTLAATAAIATSGALFGVQSSAMAISYVVGWYDTLYTCQTVGQRMLEQGYNRYTCSQPTQPSTRWRLTVS